MICLICKICNFLKFWNFFFENLINILIKQGILDGEDDTPGQQVILSTGSHDSSLSHQDLKQNLLDALSRLAAAVNNFLIMYAKAFRVDFTVENTVDAVQGKKPFLWALV